MQIRRLIWMWMFLIVISLGYSALIDGVLNYYPFDSNYTDTIGSDDFTNQGTSLDCGYNGNGVNFGGVNDFINSTPSFKLNDQDKTICYYAKYTASDSPQVIEYGINSGTRYYLHYINGANIFAYDGASADTLSTIGQSWSSYCYQQNRTNVLGHYVNGTYHSKNTFVWNNQSARLWIGILAGGSGGTDFTGCIDQLTIWSRVLSLAEIQQWTTYNGSIYIPLVPTMSITSDLVNNTVDYETLDFDVNFNVSFGGDNTNLTAQCSLLRNDTIQSTLYQVNNGSFNYFENYTVFHNWTFSINCFNNELNITTGKYIKAIDTTKTYDQVLLEQANRNLNLIYGVLNMLPLIMLYITFMVISIWLIRNNNVIAGLILYVFTLGFDTYITYWLVNTYTGNVGLANWELNFIGIFAFMVSILVFVKMMVAVTLKTKRYNYVR